MRLLLCGTIRWRRQTRAGRSMPLNRQRQEGRRRHGRGLRIAEAQGARVSGDDDQRGGVASGVVGIVAGRIKNASIGGLRRGIADDLAKGSGRFGAGHDLGDVVIRRGRMGI